MSDEKLELAVNVPATMIVKYCDLFASKQPDKYPAQVRFKGTVDGVDMVLYLDTPEVLRCLFAAGLIADIPPHADQSQIRAKGVALTLARKELTFLRAQKPKEKSKTLSINGATADTVREKPAAPADAASTPANGNGNGNGHPMREKRSALYKAMTSFVLDTIVPLYTAKEIDVSANDVHAMVATLFIAETSH